MPAPFYLHYADEVAAAVALVVAAIALPAMAALATDRVTIGTAGVMGVYFPLGGAICRMVNVTRKEHKLRCWVEPSEGSVANVKDVMSGDVDLGIAQSDVQYYALRGEGRSRTRRSPSCARCSACIRSC